MEAQGDGEDNRRANGNFQATLNEGNIEEEQEKITSYEAAFRQIKEATGVSDVNEVIQKFLTQEDTYNNLLAMTKESQARIDALQEQKEATKKRVEELKYFGSGDQTSRQSSDQFKESVSEAQQRYERHRHKYERLSKILINVKAGIQHLSDKLDTVPLEEEPIPVTDDSLVQVLHQCEKKLYKVLDAFQEEEAKEAEEKDAEKGAKDDIDVEPAVVNNVRIKVSQAQEEPQSDEEFEEEFEEDVLTRDSVKKQSGALLDKAQKKTKKKKRNARGDE